MIPLLLVLCPLAAGAQGKTDPDPVRVGVGAAVGGTDLRRLGAEGRGGDFLGYRLSAAYRPTERHSVGLRADLRLYSLAAGPEVEFAPAGMLVSGPVLVTSLQGVRTGLSCRANDLDCGEPRDAPALWGTGTQLNAGGGFRFSWRDGRRGLSVTTELSIAHLWSNRPAYSGWYAGGFKGVFFVFDT